MKYFTIDLIHEMYEIVENGNIKETKNWIQKILAEQYYLHEDLTNQNLQQYLVGLSSIIGDNVIRKGVNNEEVLTLCKRYVDLSYRAKYPFEYTEILMKLVEELSILISLVKSEKADSFYCSRTIGYVSSHIHEPMKTIDIANWLKISRGYLSEIFHQEMQETLSHYIRRKKIEYACIQFQIGNKHMSEISVELGFSSQSHFTKAFKEMMHITPYEYKMKNKASEWVEITNKSKIK